MPETRDALGETMKNARTELEMTQSQLAERLGVSNRYIMLIETSRKKPSYKLLFKIIQTLNIQPDLIFYPSIPSKVSHIEDLVRMLLRCDERSMKVIRATVKAALEAQPKE